MTNIPSDEQRAKITESMKALGSLCPNRFGALACSKKCMYKARYVCPAELSIYIQHFLESTECMSAEELVGEDKYDACMHVLTKGCGIHIDDAHRARNMLCENPCLLDDIVYAARRVYAEFGKEVELELRTSKYWKEGPTHTILIVRLPSYNDENIMSILDNIGEEVDNNSKSENGLFLLTSDFKIIEVNV